LIVVEGLALPEAAAVLGRFAGLRSSPRRSGWLMRCFVVAVLAAEVGPVDRR